MFTLVSVALLVVGWLIRDEEYWTAKEGLGYWLGIVGGVLLLLQFLYPVRKNARFMRSWGSVKNWFAMHKVLGIVGPMLILYHGNFRLHAVNSNVAMFAMIIVVISGLIGRYIYLKIHSSHFGEMLSLQDMQKQFGITRDEMDHEKYITRRVKNRLHEFEDWAFAPSKGLVHGGMRLLMLGQRKRRARAQAIRELKHGLSDLAKRKGLAADSELLRTRLQHDRELVNEYFKAVTRIVEFSAYRRMFSMWHVLHVPLFFMLLVTGVVHVVAVHMY